MLPKPGSSEPLRRIRESMQSRELSEHLTRGICPDCLSTRFSEIAEGDVASSTASAISVHQSGQSPDLDRRRCAYVELDERIRTPFRRARDSVTSEELCVRISERSIGRFGLCWDWRSSHSRSSGHRQRGGISASFR
jgi:hypothetical protein